MAAISASLCDGRASEPSAYSDCGNGVDGGGIDDGIAVGDGIGKHSGGGGADEHSRRAVMGMTLRDLTEIVITLGGMAVTGSTLVCMAVVDSILA